MFLFRFVLEDGVLKYIAQYAHGDARAALNALDLILQAKLNSSSKSEEEPCFISLDQFKEGEVLLLECLFSLLLFGHRLFYD